MKTNYEIEEHFDPNAIENQSDTYEYTSTNVLENSTKMYRKLLNDIPRLTYEEEKDVYERIIKGDDSARNILVENNVRLVMSIAKHYSHPGLPFEDIVQEGNLGLIKAAERFDPTKGFKFTTYATYWIRQVIGRALTLKTSPLKTSTSHKDLIKRADRAEDHLTSVYGRTPTLKEISEYIGESIDKIENARSSMLTLSSIDSPIGDGEEDSSLVDVIEDTITVTPEERTMNLELHEQLTKVLNTLTEFEREVIELRFGLNNKQAMTIKDIATLYKCTPTHVNNIERRALQKLRRPERSDKLRDFVD